MGLPRPLLRPARVRQQAASVELLDRHAAAAIGDEVHELPPVLPMIVGAGFKPALSHHTLNWTRGGL